MAVDGCQVLVQMAKNNLCNLTKMRKLTASMVNWMQMFAAGRNLHAAAMMTVTALGVCNFSFENTSPHKLNQNFFGEAGAIQLMLAGLHSYARSLFAWPMTTAATVVQALDAVCRDHFINTTSFIQARRVHVIIRAAFATTMKPDTVNGINFSSQTFANTFAMIKNILSHTDRKRKNCADGLLLPSEQLEDANAPANMPFLNLLSVKFANTCNKQVCSWQQYTITQLAVLCLKAAVRGLEEKTKTQKPSDALVEICLEMLCICMLAPAGMAEMRENGVQVVIILLQMNAAKKTGSLSIDIACTQVLAMAASRSRMLSLHDGLLAAAMGVPGPSDGIHVRVSAKTQKDPEFAASACRAKHAVVKLRIALVRMQIKECMHLLLPAATDQVDTVEITKHIRVRVGSQEEHPCKMRDGESHTVNTQMLFRRSSRVRVFVNCMFAALALTENTHTRMPSSQIAYLSWRKNTTSAKWFVISKLDYESCCTLFALCVNDPILTISCACRLKKWPTSWLGSKSANRKFGPLKAAERDLGVQVCAATTPCRKTATKNNTRMSPKTPAKQKSTRPPGLWPQCCAHPCCHSSRAPSMETTSVS